MPRSLLAALTTFTLALAVPAAASAELKIQPGAFVASSVGACTLNFVFDGQGKNLGKTYIGTAAHCVEKIGEEVLDKNGAAFGKVAYIGQAGNVPTDYAFIEVNADQLGRVDPAMKGHPDYPTGITTADDTTDGDAIQISGYGVGFDLLPQTQEGRQAILIGDDDETYWFDGSSVNGDSGGGLVHIPSGKALGLVSQYGTSTATTDYGPTWQGILTKVASTFPVTMRLAHQSAPPVAAPSGAPSGGSAQPSSNQSPSPAGSSAKSPAKRTSDKAKRTAKKTCKTVKKHGKKVKRCKRTKRKH